MKFTKLRCPTCKKESFELRENAYGDEVMSCTLCDGLITVKSLCYFNSGWNACEKEMNKVVAVQTTTAPAVKPEAGQPA